jgi:hypothetical protein
MLLFHIIFESKPTDPRSAAVPDFVLGKFKAFVVTGISPAMFVVLPCCQQIIIPSI